MNFLQKLENKFGRFAIRNLTKYIIAAYIAGYVIELLGQYSGSYFYLFLTLNPGAIMRGQVWRLVSWVLMPPSSISVFTVIMLICYYQLGTVLEQVWGAFTYNFYIFFGLLMTVAGAFLMYYISPSGAYYIEMTAGLTFTTYYVSLSIFLGFAMTFPDQRMLLFFIIPIKIKYLAVFDVAYLTYCVIVGNWLVRVPIICSLASTILFFLMTRKYSFKNSYTNAQSRKRRAEFKRAMGQAQARNASGARHKCAVCGQTELSNPNLEFRYCSKCRGNYEYCQTHLFTHTHVL